MYLKIVTFVLLLGVLWAVPAGAAKAETQDWTDTAAEWGIVPLGLYVDARGRTSEFRYRVSDAAKALPLLDSIRRPLLARLRKDGSQGRLYQSALPVRFGNQDLLRTNPDPERLYYLHVYHPALPLDPGDEVSFGLGPLRVEKLLVREWK